jgi:hypothetical protein
MWLDAVLYAPPLCLDEQAFQDAARVRMGVCIFSSYGNAWTCACGHTVEDDNVANALSNWLSGLVQSRHNDTVKALQEFVGHLGYHSAKSKELTKRLRAPQVNQNARTKDQQPINPEPEVSGA